MQEDVKAAKYESNINIKAAEHQSYGMLEQENVRAIKY